jgi:hypothetical protein
MWAATSEQRWRQNTAQKISGYYLESMIGRLRALTDSAAKRFGSGQILKARADALGKEGNFPLSPAQFL